MNFIKTLPHQNSKSPKLTEDYFDSEAKELLDICRKHKFDIYYDVVKCIKDKKTEILLHEKTNRPIMTDALKIELARSGFHTTFWTVPHTGSLYGRGNTVCLRNKHSN